MKNRDDILSKRVSYSIRQVVLVDCLHENIKNNIVQSKETENK